MTFTSIPDNYTPLTSPLIYRFGFDEPQQSVEVRIVDVAHNTTLGIRRMQGVQSAEIDIAPYLKHCFALNPIEGGTGLADADRLYAVVAVEVGEVRSEQRYFSPYLVTEGVGTLFRGSTKAQAISRGESDYVVIYAPNGGDIFCELYEGELAIDGLSFSIEPQPGLQVLKFSPEEFTQSADSVIVEFAIDGVMDYLTYRIVPKSELSKRLMWLAADGTLQLYTFPMCRCLHTRIEKQRIESAEGHQVTSCRSERVWTMVSDYETTAEMERLSEIIESPFVMLDCGQTSVRVDVLSTESVVRYGGALNSLQIDIRPYDRKEREL